MLGRPAGYTCSRSDPASGCEEGILRALVIAPQPFFTPRGTPLSVYHRSLVETRLGVEVDLLTYGGGEDVEIPGLRILRIPSFAWLGEVPVGPSYTKLFLDQFLLLWTIGLLLRRRYDFVHAHEEAVFFCRLLKPIFGFKLVYDMHSSLPEQLRNFRFTSSPLILRLFRRLELSALRSADAVITICPDLAEHVLRLGIPLDQHFLIENSLIEPVRLKREPGRIDVPDAEADEALGSLPGGAPIVAYAGTLEPYQGIDLLLRSFQELCTRVADAHLLVVGGTPEQRARYEGAASSLGIADHCRFTGRLSQTAANACCARATLQVSPRTSGTNTPLKLYQQLASGVAIVATRIPAHTQVLDESAAFLADPEPIALADALEHGLRDAKLRMHKADQAKRLYEERYSRQRYMQKLSECLKRLA